MPPLPRGHKHPDELRERAVRMELGHAHEPVALDGDLLNPELKRAPATGRRVEAHQQKAVNGLNAHFGDETTEHVETLEGLIAGLGGDPGYISPAARATEKAGIGLLESTFLLAGSVDLMTQELAMLDAVLLAVAKDHANRSCLAGMVEDLPAGEVRDAFQTAVDEVEVQENEHLRWAQDMRWRMISLQATSGPTSSVALKAEDMMARIKGLFD
jgi:hypothetical protein